MPIDIPAGSDFENFQMKVTDQDGNEIAFQDFDVVSVTLVDEHGGTVAKYDTAGTDNPLALVDTTGTGDKETLELDIFGDDISKYTFETHVFAQIDVEYTSRVGYSGSYKRLFADKHVINIFKRL
jgi:hypothetical protein